jgi:glycerol-3-phosphate dehydrogenase (NAD(P)+)
MRVGVVGAGAWGTTLAALVSSTADTLLWAREPEVVTSISQTHENAMFLAGQPLPLALRATNDLASAVAEADIVFTAVPAQHVRAIATRFSPHLPSGAIVVNLAKGIEEGTCKLMSGVLADALPRHSPDLIGVLSGPNLAREVIAGHPSATCVAFEDAEVAERVQRLLMRDSFRVYTSDDVVGCQVGGAIKNVIAIAAGVADGLGFGMNTRAALLTRGLAELTRLGVALGGRPLTFLGLAGNGDLLATCSSSLSRNFRVGRMLASGRAIDDITSEMTVVAEGVATAPVAVEIADRSGVDMPIAVAVRDLLSGEHTAGALVARLMQREGKAELDGLESRAGL